MSVTSGATRRPLSVYVTAQVVGVPIALAAGWGLLQAGVPVWGAAVPWVLLTVHLSRKRLPSEAVGSALHLAGAVAVLWPLAYLPRVDDAGTGALAVLREFVGPALVLLVAGAAAYVVGHLLKRRAARKLARRARSDPSPLE